MKKLLSVALLLLFGACNEQSTFIPDNSSLFTHDLQLQSDIQDALNDLFSSRLDALDQRMSDLEGRLTVVEGSIDSMTGQLTDLFDDVADLQQADADIRQDFSNAVDELKAADQKTRRLLFSKFNRLQKALNKEIQNRSLGDQILRNKLRNLSRDFDVFTAQQQVINKLLAVGLFIAQHEISVLESDLKKLAKKVHDNNEEVEKELAKIKKQIKVIQTNITDIGTELDSIKDKLTAVVYPCGDDSEALLQTQDGLVGVFSIGTSKDITFQDSDVVPAHAVCNKVVNIPFLGINNACIQATQVPAQVFDQQTTISYFSLDEVKLGVLTDGNYTTGMGWSCDFQVSGGEVVE